MAQSGTSQAKTNHTLDTTWRDGHFASFSYVNEEKEHVANASVEELTVAKNDRKKASSSSFFVARCKEAQLMTDVLRDLGAFGDRTGTTLARETGLESGSGLGLLTSINSTAGRMKVNFDPANLLMNGFEPLGKPAGATPVAPAVRQKPACQRGHCGWRR